LNVPRPCHVTLPLAPNHGHSRRAEQRTELRNGTSQTVRLDLLTSRSEPSWHDGCLPERKAVGPRREASLLDGVVLQVGHEGAVLGRQTGQILRLSLALRIVDKALVEYQNCVEELAAA
jgi:hypothetical protein